MHYIVNVLCLLEKSNTPSTSLPLSPTLSLIYDLVIFCPRETILRTTSSHGSALHVADGPSYNIGHMYSLHLTELNEQVFTITDIEALIHPRIILPSLLPCRELEEQSTAK